MPVKGACRARITLLVLAIMLAAIVVTAGADAAGAQTAPFGEPHPPAWGRRKAAPEKPSLCAHAGDHAHAGGHAHASAGHHHDHFHNEEPDVLPWGHAHGPEPQELAGPGGWRRGWSAILAVGLRPCS